MLKKIGFITLALSLLGGTSIALAMPDTERTNAHNNNGNVDVAIPAHAIEVADNVFSLGEQTDPESGEKVEGYLIVHPKENGKKPDGTPGGGNGNGGNNGGDPTNSCYGFLAKDAKWKTVEPWVVDPSNGEGISENDVFSILDEGITKWEDAADGTVDGSVSVNILGNGSVDSGFATDGSLDGINGVVFGELEPGTIGITIVWGIFGGNPRNRELVEWDQVYNTYYSWNTDGSLSDMDFDSIATHELGHSVGLADLYQAECSEETMYGYGSEGEIDARDLNEGDIAGISNLY